MNAPTDDKRPSILSGSRQEIRLHITSYCIENFEDRDIWLIDSSQIFDPYLAMRLSPSTARAMLKRIHICRPFTSHQLRDRVISLKMLKLRPSSTVIISGIDAFLEDMQDDSQSIAIMDRMINTINQIRLIRGCKFLIGLIGHIDPGILEKNLGGVNRWEEQYCQQDTKLNTVLANYGNISVVCETKTETHSNTSTQT